MLLFSGMLVVSIVLAAVSLTRPTDSETLDYPPSRRLVLIALIPMGLALAFFLIFGVGEMTGGDPSGVVHLAPAALIALLMVLVFRTPFEGGLALLVIGVFNAGYFAMSSGDAASRGVLALLLGGTFIVSGVLCIAAALIATRKGPDTTAPFGHA